MGGSLLIRGMAAWGIALGGFMGTGAQAAPDWSENAPLPRAGRPNPYGLDSRTWGRSLERGRLHALQYPVEVTGVLIPYRPLEKILTLPAWNPLKFRFVTALGIREPVTTPAAFFEWLGMSPYPEPTDRGIYRVPYPGGKRPDYPMGVSLVSTEDGLGATIGCAACHGGSLFGKRVLGLTNRFPRANDFFFKGKDLVGQVPGWLFHLALFTTPGEKRMYDRAQEHLRFVNSRVPQTLGLDTSLAHTALSLARRAPDEVATRDRRYARRPDPDYLDDHPADSKPAVWWNLKYKNRWLSDGSVVSGNPIYTNILWNEIGRGVDLEKLEAWLDANPDTVRDLTTAVFASEAPRITDFFPPERFDLTRAKRGEVLFETYCARCHGNYAKAWSRSDAATLSLREQLTTTEVTYPNPTPVVDVGTDPARYLGMVSLADRLNPLAVSRRKGILIRPQRGYVPPPLVGIWARWPYFHNNSAPSLCAVLSPSGERPIRYHAGPAEDARRDFDLECNGYPSGSRVPAAWRKRAEWLYDTRRKGMGNFGHDEGIFLSDGESWLSAEDKRDLIVFLQTL